MSNEGAEMECSLLVVKVHLYIGLFFLFPFLAEISPLAQGCDSPAALLFSIGRAGSSFAMWPGTK